MCSTVLRFDLNRVPPIRPNALWPILYLKFVLVFCLNLNYIN